MGARMPLVGAGASTYGHAQAIIPRLSRIRRLVQENAEGATPPIAKLRALLQETVIGFEECVAEMRRVAAIREQKRQGQQPFPEWEEWERRFVTAPAAVYLLAEFKSFDSLPLLQWVIDQQKRSPVSRLFVLVAMHRLVVQLPREKLTVEASAALEEYLKAVGESIPPVVPQLLPAWNAKITEHDVRISVMGTPLDLSKQPKTKIVFYPGALYKLEKFMHVHDAPGFGLDPKVHGWMAKMKKFVKLAYPGG